MATNISHHNLAIFSTTSPIKCLDICLTTKRCIQKGCRIMRRFASDSPICDTISTHRGTMKENVRNGRVWNGRSAKHWCVQRPATVLPERALATMAYTAVPGTINMPQVSGSFAPLRVWELGYGPGNVPRFQTPPRLAALKGP